MLGTYIPAASCAVQDKMYFPVIKGHFMTVSPPATDYYGIAESFSRVLMDESYA